MLEQLADAFKTTDLTPQALIGLQSYMDGVFRLIILIYSLSLAALAFSKGYLIISLILSLMILLSIAYGFYTIVTVGAVMKKIPGYNPVNLIFYYVETSFLILLFLSVMYYLVKPFKRKNKRVGKMLGIDD